MKLELMKTDRKLNKEFFTPIVTTIYKSRFTEVDLSQESSRDFISDFAIDITTEIRKNPIILHIIDK